MLRRKWSTFLLVALIAGSGSASADIIFTLGNHPQADEANILFAAAQTGTTITAEVDHTGVAAIFSTLTGQTLQQTAQGQADIFNVTGGLLTSMDFKLQTGYTFGDFIMNLQNGTGTAHVLAIADNDASFDYNLGPGQNFLTLTTASGESISEVQVTMLNGIGGWLDFKQPRISQVCSGATCVTPLPEPAALLIFGATLFGLAVTARRKL